MDAERRMLAMPRNRRFVKKKFRRQHPIPPYVVDFFCDEAHLVIEVDGGQQGEATTGGPLFWKKRGYV